VSLLPNPADPKDRPWVWPFLVGILALAASIGGLSNQFTQDDIPIIWKNPAIHSLGGIAELFTRAYWPPPFLQALYRPLASVSFALEWALGGGSPMMFRVVSYLLYAGVSVGVFYVARLRLPTIVAFGAAALFAVHPLHVEAVAVAVNQSELWVGLLFCVAVYRYVRVRDRGEALSGRELLLLAGLYLVACLFKETALVLPGMLVAAEVLLVRNSQPVRVRIAQGRLPLLLLMLVALAFYWVRTQVLSGSLLGTFVVETLVGLSMGERALTMLAVVPEWLRLMLWPAHLRADYSAAELVAHTAWGPMQTLGLLILLILVALLIAAWRRAPVIAFGLAWCAIGIFPVHNVLVPTGIVLAERTLFLPSIGAMLVLGGLGSLLLERASHSTRVVLASVTGILLVLGAYRSTTRHPVWSDQFNLWYQTATVDAPRSFRAHEALAEAYFQIEMERMAEVEYRLAIQYAPRQLTRPSMSYAHRLRSRGFCYPAAALYRKALQVYPSFLAAQAGLIACALDLGLYREAALNARLAISMDWERPAFQIALAVADSALRAGAPPGTVRLRIPDKYVMSEVLTVGPRKLGPDK
jgi:tetratricopeptide (TPR) repeat protein